MTSNSVSFDLVPAVPLGSEPIDEFEALSNPALTKLYLKARREYREILKRCVRISRGSGGLPSTGRRMFWGCILFTRIVVTAKSLDRLLPDPKPGEHWDFSAAGAIARNLLEACLVYQWLCSAEIEDDEREARFILLDLHDNGSRERMFPEGPSNPEVLADLIRRFDENPVLAKWDEKKRRMALRGDRTPFIQDDVLTEMGIDTILFRLIYRMFSQHTHTGPISFYRMAEHDRGMGVESRHEKRYLLMTIGLASDFLLNASATQLDIVPDAETRAPYLTDAQVRSNVEREQGRSSRRKPR